jgi:hypothetical protein
MRSAATTKVYGRRNASLTIHIFGAPEPAQAERKRETKRKPIIAHLIRNENPEALYRKSIRAVPS